MTYKELWIKKHPNEDFLSSGCRDNEFDLETDCSGKECEDCYNEECPIESEDKDESTL